jgi:hypothetical protein
MKSGRERECDGSGIGWPSEGNFSTSPTKLTYLGDPTIDASLQRVEQQLGTCKAVVRNKSAVQVAPGAYTSRYGESKEEREGVEEETTLEQASSLRLAMLSGVVVVTVGAFLLI